VFGKNNYVRLYQYINENNILCNENLGLEANFQQKWLQLNELMTYYKFLMTKYQWKVYFVTCIRLLTVLIMMLAIKVEVLWYC
jgi:hypothetical protein